MPTRSFSYTHKAALFPAMQPGQKRTYDLDPGRERWDDSIAHHGAAIIKGDFCQSAQNKKAPFLLFSQLSLALFCAVLATTALFWQLLRCGGKSYITNACVCACVLCILTSRASTCMILHACMCLILLPKPGVLYNLQRCSLPFKIINYSNLHVLVGIRFWSYGKDPQTP